MSINGQVNAPLVSASNFCTNISRSTMSPSESESLGFSNMLSGTSTFNTIP